VRRAAVIKQLQGFPGVMYRGRCVSVEPTNGFFGSEAALQPQGLWLAPIRPKPAPQTRSETIHIERQLLREKQTVATWLLCTHEGRLTANSGRSLQKKKTSFEVEYRQSGPALWARAPQPRRAAVAWAVCTPLVSVGARRTGGRPISQFANVWRAYYSMSMTTLMK